MLFPQKLPGMSVVKLSNALIERYTQENGEYPKTLGLSVWEPLPCGLGVMILQRHWLYWAFNRCRMVVSGSGL